jgi:hypothetical protein
MMRRIAFALLTIFLVLGCAPTQVADDQPQTTTQATLPMVNGTSSTVTSTPPPTGTPVPVSVEPSPTPELSAVTLTVTKGQIYIRRGPGLPYNQIGILKEGDSAVVVGQDVLSRWVQIQLTDAGQTGWVSVMTDFTRVDGELASVPNFTFTEWFQPAYIKNCTEHDLLIEPDGLYLYNLYLNPRGLNEVQVNPGVYTIVDLFVEGEPEIETVYLTEGDTAYITVNGLGQSHFCP